MSLMGTKSKQHTAEFKAKVALAAINGEHTASGRPDTFNSDQGCQFTSIEFTDRLKADGIQISMDGCGRAMDNISVERLWPASSTRTSI